MVKLEHTMQCTLLRHAIQCKLWWGLITRCLPGTHVTPSPMKPGLQMHWKLPSVLVQVASAAQLLPPNAHSLMSACRYRIGQLKHNQKLLMTQKFST